MVSLFLADVCEVKNEKGRICLVLVEEDDVSGVCLLWI